MHGRIRPFGREPVSLPLFTPIEETEYGMSWHELAMVRQASRGVTADQGKGLALYNDASVEQEI